MATVRTVICNSRKQDSYVYEYGVGILLLPTVFIAACRDAPRQTAETQRHGRGAIGTTRDADARRPAARCVLSHVSF